MIGSEAAILPPHDLNEALMLEHSGLNARIKAFAAASNFFTGKFRVKVTRGSVQPNQGEIMKMRRIIGLFIAVAGCATERPDPLVGCGSQFFGYQPKLEERGVGTEKEMTQSAEFDKESGFARSEAPLIGSLVAAIEAAPQRHYFDILVLSGGGKWGAYGAGFLAGWTAADRVAPDEPGHVKRCHVSVTTGISTGSMQIAAAYAATTEAEDGDCDITAIGEADATLRDAYTVDTENLVNKRGTTSIIRSLSIYDVAALEEKTLKTVAQYAPKYAALPAHKRAYAGLVNLEDRAFYIADIDGLARLIPSEELRNACIVEALLGSSAVPVVYPPRFIEDGAFVDGGARFGVFGSALLSNTEVKAALKARGLKPRLSVIINGNLSADAPCLAEVNLKGCKTQQTEGDESKLSLVDLAFASMSVAVDQISNDSVARLESDLRREYGEGGYSSRYTYLRNEEIESEMNGSCKLFLNETEHAEFDNDFMKCAYEIGMRKGIAQAWEGYPGYRVTSN